MRLRTAKLSALLFSSGLCALIYQTRWTRELRLMLGASTAASPEPAEPQPKPLDVSENQAFGADGG